MSEISFSIYYLYAGEDFFSADLCKKVVTNDKIFKKENSSTVYNISIEFDEDKKYLWIYSKHGTALPYSTEIYDTEDERIKINPRQSTQAELNRQFFALYSLKTKQLYISHNDFKNTLIQHLSSLSQIDKSIETKKLYSSVSDYLSVLKKVNNIKFTSSKNLFNADSDLFKIIGDNTGLGAPNQYKIEASFKSTSITDRFKT